MFATRDQENLVHAHQTAAAGKSLNQGIRQLAPKTPGNKIPKTPFKIPLHDENDPLAMGGGKRTGGKGLGKGNENITLNTQKKTAGLDRNAFITPLGPRNRAPLGAKTTNAKAKAFQTPGQQDSVKPQKTLKKGSTTRKKQLIIPKEETLAEVAPIKPVEEERDVEYCPPRPTALPDDPEEFPYDDTFPQFQGANFSRGWLELGKERAGADGLTTAERHYKKQSEECDRRIEAQLQKDIDNMELLGINVRAYPDEPCIEEQLAAERQAAKTTTATKPSSSRGIDTVRSRTAATALSGTIKKPATTIKPRQVAVPKARAVSSTAKRPALAATRTSSTQHAAAAATSRTTVGYSKGRNVSNSLKRTPLSATSFRSASNPQASTVDKSKLSPAMYIQLYGTPPIGSDMWYRCHDAGCFTETNDDELEDALKGTAPPPLFDDDEDFQLTL